MTTVSAFAASLTCVGKPAPPAADYARLEHVFYFDIRHSLLLSEGLTIISIIAWDFAVGKARVLLVIDLAGDGGGRNQADPARGIM